MAEAPAYPKPIWFVVRGESAKNPLSIRCPVVRPMPLIETKIGLKVSAPVAVFRFRKNGAIHFLRFGNETPAARIPANPILRSPGQATTNVEITRTTKTEWKIEAPGGSIGRLSKWTPGNREREQSDRFDDLGLYQFSLELNLDLQRLLNDRLVNGEFVREPVAK